MEPKQAVLESKIDYVKIGINGTLEVVCAHKLAVIVPGKKNILS
jgi:hypothetical protein